MKDLQTQSAVHFEKELEEAFFFDEGGMPGNAQASRLQHTVVRFLSFKHDAALNNIFTQCLTMEFTLTPKIFLNEDASAYLSNLGKRSQNDRVSRNFF